MFKFFFKTKKEMQGIIDATRKALADAEAKVVERNKFIQYEVEKNKTLEKKIKDLENNIEFLYNNLSPQKKKLVRPDKLN